VIFDVDCVLKGKSMAIPATLLRDWAEEELDVEEEEEEEDFYPSSDGKPMGETDWHVALLAQSVFMLRAYYAARPDIYIAGNNFIYYEKGNPTARVSPDTYVIFGAGMRFRRSYKVWEEGGKLPSLVIEYTSRDTRKEDNVTKFALYERLGVAEYFQFDPSEFKRRRVRLKGWRLHEGKYSEIPLTGEKFSGRMFSEQLQLELVQDEDMLRFFNPQTGEFLRTPEEAENERQAQKRLLEAEHRLLEAERRRADKAEAELKTLRRLLEDRGKRNLGTSES
jgi:Uma2 family endonuclease